MLTLRRVELAYLGQQAIRVVPAVTVLTAAVVYGVGHANGPRFKTVDGAFCWAHHTVCSGTKHSRYLVSIACPYHGSNATKFETVSDKVSNLRAEKQLDGYGLGAGVVKGIQFVTMPLCNSGK